MDSNQDVVVGALVLVRDTFPGSSCTWKIDTQGKVSVQEAPDISKADTKELLDLFSRKGISFPGKIALCSSLSAELYFRVGTEHGETLLTAKHCIENDYLYAIDHVVIEGPVVHVHWKGFPECDATPMHPSHFPFGSTLENMYLEALHRGKKRTTRASNHPRRTARMGLGRRRPIHDHEPPTHMLNPNP